MLLCVVCCVWSAVCGLLCVVCCVHVRGVYVCMCMYCVCVFVCLCVAACNRLIVLRVACMCLNVACCVLHVACCVLCNLAVLLGLSSGL